MSRTVPALTVRFRDDTDDETRGIVTALLSDFSTAAVHELNDTEWRVFFRSAGDRDAAATALGGRCSVSSVDVPDEDWARRSQENLRAIAVGGIVVAPPWDVPDDNPLLIVIEPSMGFGTGHHATTRLCLRALQGTALHGKVVIDVGTGSGVLAIAAAILGARSVIALDNDPDAIEAARANVERNGAAIDLRLADLESSTLPRGDVVLANLTGAMLRRYTPALAALAPRGTLILSGFLTDETPDVQRAFAPLVSSSSREDEDGWSSLVLNLV